MTNVFGVFLTWDCTKPRYRTIELAFRGFIIPPVTGLNPVSIDRTKESIVRIDDGLPLFHPLLYPFVRPFFFLFFLSLRVIVRKVLPTGGTGNDARVLAGISIGFL